MTERQQRRLIMPNGPDKLVMLPICHCKIGPSYKGDISYRRGPPGGVCGNCGRAIPRLLPNPGDLK